MTTGTRSAWKASGPQRACLEIGHDVKRIWHVKNMTSAVSKAAFARWSMRSPFHAIPYAAGTVPYTRERLVAPCLCCFVSWLNATAPWRTLLASYLPATRVEGSPLAAGWMQRLSDIFHGVPILRLHRSSSGGRMIHASFRATEEEPQTEDVENWLANESSIKASANVCPGGSSRTRSLQTAHDRFFDCTLFRSIECRSRH
jgi:hypothetical protein